MLHDINLALSGLKLVSKVNGKIISLTPEIYTNVLLHSHSPSPQYYIVVAHICDPFYNVLTVELQETIKLDEYIYSIFLLSLPFIQTSALQILKKKSVIAFKHLSD